MFVSLHVLRTKSDKNMATKTKSTKKVDNLINFLIWIPLMLFVIPGVALLWLCTTLFETLVTKVLKRNNYRAPNGLTDSSMCHGGSYSLPNTNAAQIWIVDGKWITVDEFTTHFHKCFLEGNSDKYKNLYAHVTTYGTYSFYSHCKPEHLDLSWHIRQYSLQDFGHGTVESWAVTWMTTNTYEVGRPVWQVAILHLGNEKEGTMETCIVGKFSHALVDGYSFVQMVEKLADNPAPYMVKSRPYTFSEKVKYILTGPKPVFSKMGCLAFSRNSQSPYTTVLQSAPKPHPWNMSFATLDLNTVKKIRKATDTHFVCLMISAQFGAMRRLLLETKSEKELPEFLWVGSSLPWPQHPRKLTNHWTMGFMQCPVRLADPMERLRWVEASYQSWKKEELDVKGLLLIMKVVRMLPAYVRRFFLRYNPCINNISFFFASLLLSSKQHYLLGRRVKKLYLPLALPDLCPIVSYGVTTSHSGQIDLSISSSTAFAKTQEELDRLTKIYFTEELDAIAFHSGLKSFE